MKDSSLATDEVGPQTLKSNGKGVGDPLEMIVAKVKSVLPDGWSAGLELGRSGSELAPTIVIRTNDIVEVSYAIPGAPTPEAATSTSKEVVSIEYVLRKSMIPVEHRIASATDRQNTQQRIKFQRENLKHLLYTHKGSAPIPPGAFRANSKADQKLLTQYACLWINTPITHLPTPHANSLSFERVYAPRQIRDQRKAVEFNGIETQLSKIFTPYE